MVVRRLPLHAAKAFQKKLATIPSKARLAVIAAGSMGDPELIPWLLGQMKTPTLARAAGEAFGLITGAHLAIEKLEGRKPEGYTDEAEDSDTDEYLPWPDVNAVEAWWKARRDGFESGARYILGTLPSIEPLRHALRVANQRQRAAAALELAIVYPGTPLFEVHAPGFRQREALANSRSKRS
jgi:uncharacterized protein (TIGR02270 family)